MLKCNLLQVRSYHICETSQRCISTDSSSVFTVHSTRGCRLWVCRLWPYVCSSVFI